MDSIDCHPNDKLERPDQAHTDLWSRPWARFTPCLNGSGREMQPRPGNYVKRAELPAEERER
jgi:hypothetical protein